MLDAIGNERVLGYGTLTPISGNDQARISAGVQSTAVALLKRDDPFFGILGEGRAKLAKHARAAGNVGVFRSDLGSQLDAKSGRVGGRT
jgi:hypothetical protein